LSVADLKRLAPPLEKNPSASHSIATAMMGICILTGVLTVFWLLGVFEYVPDDYDPDEHVCVLWDYGTSSYSDHDDECLSIEGENDMPISLITISSVSFSFSVLLFLYSMSSALQESSNDGEE